MTNNSILSTLVLSIFLFAFMLSSSSISWAQTHCISGVSDLDLECGNLDWEFIYADLDGAFVHTCGDESDVLAIQLSIDVSIDSVNCSDPLDPKLKIIVTRVFTADIIDPLATDCVNGAGLVCSTQIINYRDFTAPSFTNFPADSTVTCENWDLLDYLISGTFDFLPIDDCGNVATAPMTLDTIMGSCSAEQEFHWESVITDGCNNSFSKIHSVFIVDTVGPQITFLPSVFEPFECVEDILWPEIDPLDMCSGVELKWWGDTSQTVLDCPNNVHFSRTAYAVDFCGNLDSATYEIQVNDLTLPEFEYIPLGFSIQCDEEPEFADPIAVDGCAGQVTITEQIDTLFSPNCEQNYTLKRVFTATDVCGNSNQGEQLIIVSDMTSPLLTPPLDLFVNCDETFDLDDAISWDNCDPNPTVELFTDTINITSAGTYDIIREFTSTDACENSYTSTQIISVVDNTPPYFTIFPENLLVLCGDSLPDDTLAYEDSCDPNANLSYEEQFDFQPCANNTVFSRIFTISDEAGNELTEIQYITYLDEDPPILLTPLDSLFYQCAYEVPECLEIFEGLEFDDCSSGDVVPIDCDDVVVEGNCEEQACIIERTYFFEDACGNQGSAKQYITVQESVLNPEMPTGITPNGDGLNDAFVIKGIGPSLNTEPGEVQCDWLEDTNMRVINRWGSLVFEEANYRNDWEGTNESGEDLPQGTYFVVFEALGESFSTYLDLRR
ncbi:MAG: hypothetical protein CL831_03815 [Crocinitomicaceae bacterium]|nr:hypothetical protein [Crocinitomicaceae bacterium]